MNNNRGNNRRRGRGNRQNGGGGQQLNRIDSRARGNAPQLLEKYRKLAQDAHLNGDRVQAEYYLQFADHYFRVIADQRSRQEEQRLRREDRWQEGGENFREDADDAGEFASDNDFPTFDQPPSYTRREREDREEWQSRDEPAERPAREAPSEDSGEGSRNIYEPVENPFVRDNRPARGLRPRRDERRPARGNPAEAPADEGDAPAGLDPASLPPPISAARSSDDETDAKPRRGRPRKPRPSDDAAGEALETVS